MKIYEYMRHRRLKGTMAYLSPYLHQVIMESPIDAVTVIAAGMTLVEAIKAADTLSDLGINIRIIDPFTIKPIDADTIGNAARATGGRVVTVEDHYAEGNLLLI